jgi:L-fuculose-phosphate aldolase
MAAAVQSVREQVAWACRILALEGYADLTLGHVSARPDGDDIVQIKRKGVALDEVDPDDVIELDLAHDEVPLTPEMHLEAVLHTEVYKRRDDVRCVVHGHPPYATAFGATGADFEILTHDGILFPAGVGAYGGMPDLIVDEQQGAQVAGALGAGSALLLRNHGVLIAERSVEWATLAGVLLERSLRIQSIAQTFGPLQPIAPEWVQEIHPRKYQDGFSAEYWDAWVRELRRDGRAFGMPDEDGA